MIGSQEIPGIQTQNFISQRLSEIDYLLHHNFLVINELQHRVSGLVELNHKIARELAIEGIEPEKNNLLLEDSSLQEKFIERIFLKSKYSLSLYLTTPLKKPLFKDRNFKIHVGLHDRDHKPLYNRNSITLQMSVYESTESAEQIDSNKLGEPITRGNTQVQLMEGQALFQKISIREVSSKFQRGLVNLVIYVKSPPFDRDDQVDYRQIRPLVIKDVSVRAKKLH